MNVAIQDHESSSSSSSDHEESSEMNFLNLFIYIYEITYVEFD
jgi:hypothetical protein